MELILIDDDEAMKRDLMALVVRSQGWEPLAADGARALELALERQPQLMLLGAFKSSPGEFRDIFETLRD
jgi:CheY-like chemotaxis protein